MTKTRILLIDDEAMLTHLLKINLEATGRYEVRVERCGANGHAAAQAFQPDLILLDLIIPDMDGGQVASQLQQDPQLQSIPIVYMTALLSKQETAAHGGVFQGRPFLAKPVSMEEVVACIERILGTALPSPGEEHATVHPSKRTGVTQDD